MPIRVPFPILRVVCVENKASVCVLEHAEGPGLRHRGELRVGLDRPATVQLLALDVPTRFTFYNLFHNFLPEV